MAPRGKKASPKKALKPPCLMTDRHQCFPIRRTTIDTGVRTFDGVLKKNIDIEYNGFEWIRVATWTNATGEAQGHNYSYWKDMVLHPDHRYSATNDFEIDSPKTVDDSNWNILDSLIGLDFVLGHEEDTQAPRVSITARDATSIGQKFEDRIIVPEYSQFHLYQRRIFFTAIVWFEHWPSPPEGPAEVLHWLGLRPVRLYTGIRYNTSDVLTTTTVLEGSDSSNWSSFGRNKRPPVGENAFLLHTRSEYMRYITSLGSCEPSLCSNADTPMEVDDEMPT